MLSLYKYFNIKKDMKKKTLFLYQNNDLERTKLFSFKADMIWNIFFFLFLLFFIFFFSKFNDDVCGYTHTHSKRNSFKFTHRNIN